jgi:hypothetical protein
VVRTSSWSNAVEQEAQRVAQVGLAAGDEVGRDELRDLGERHHLLGRLGEGDDAQVGALDGLRVAHQVAVELADAALHALDGGALHRAAHVGEDVDRESADGHESAWAGMGLERERAARGRRTRGAGAGRRPARAAGRGRGER